MNKGLIFMGGLALGAAAGSFLTHKILKQNYAQAAEEEITAVRTALLEDIRKRHGEETKEQQNEQKKAAVNAMTKYGAQDAQKTLDKQPKADVKPPYPIPQEVFGDPGNPHRQASFKVYLDGPIIDDDDHQVTQKEFELAVGRGALTYFNDDEDSICIRNDALKTDYEIVLLNRNYADDAP